MIAVIETIHARRMPGNNCYCKSTDFHRVEGLTAGGWPVYVCNQHPDSEVAVRNPQP